MNQQMGEQSEYCSSMGAAVCTLLWRVSRQQDAVASLLGGVGNYYNFIFRGMQLSFVLGFRCFS